MAQNRNAKKKNAKRRKRKASTLTAPILPRNSSDRICATLSTLRLPCMTTRA